MKVDVAQAPELVRAARADVGMSQRELALAAKIQQSNLAAVETGRRQISAEMLVRLLSAADYRPAIPLGRFREQIVEAGKESGVTNIRVFGSVVRGEDHSTSDIDLLVDLQDGAAGFALGTFAADVEEITGFPVDVVVDRDDSYGIGHIRRTARPL